MRRSGVPRVPGLVLARIRFGSPPLAEPGDSPTRLQCMPVQELRASSAIERVAYNRATRELSVWFAGARRRYIYADVPPDVYEALCEARSAGRFVNAEVKGRFACREHPPRRRYPA